jgi:hypothetical protein
LISASYVGRITGVSHWRLARINSLHYKNINETRDTKNGYFVKMTITKKIKMTIPIASKNEAQMKLIYQ